MTTDLAGEVSVQAKEVVEDAKTAELKVRVYVDSGHGGVHVPRAERDAARDHVSRAERDAAVNALIRGSPAVSRLSGRAKGRDRESEVSLGCAPLPQD